MVSGIVSVIANAVIPGGGSSGDNGYPSWTRARTEAAFAFYQTLHLQHRETPTKRHHNQDRGTEDKVHMKDKGDELTARVAFVALSAGSMNVSTGTEDVAGCCCVWAGYWSPHFSQQVLVFIHSAS